MKWQQTLKDNSVLNVRQARGEDAEALDSYIQQISGETDFLTFGRGEFNITPSANRSFLEQQFQAANAVYLVASIEDTIVATLNFATGHRPRIRHRGEFGMSVLQSHWGLGVGGFLLDCLVEWAQRTGFVTKLNLQVREDNTRAIALYQHKGFQQEGCLLDAMRVEGVSYNNLVMGLRVQSEN
jgi:RimJ/RimL family protein N-acetyltransferase